MDFSLFYFADDRPQGRPGDRYHLLLEGARFADDHDFAAVWTPERHFHAFGGQYPNPAVTGAAIAVTTTRVAIRAGSVVSPLHHPARVAEEWSVVDNLSHGRAGVSFASGWHAVDFILRPENFARRKDVLVRDVEAVRRLWRGEEVSFVDGNGEAVPVRIYPAPVQAELPVWLTSAGSVETFRTAGGLGAGVLTHMLGQNLDDLAGKIHVYREAFAAQAGSGGGRGHVALMVHTCVGTDLDGVKELVRAPLRAYLKSSVGLFAKAVGSLVPAGFDLERLDPADLDFLVGHSFDRYFHGGGLFGSVQDCLATVARLDAIGVDEVACLIDFGLDFSTVLDGLNRLDEVRRCHAKATSP